MNSSQRVLIGVLVVAVVLLFAMFSSGPLFSPENPSQQISCGLGRGSEAVDGFSPSLQEPSSSTTQDPRPGNPPPYNNCLPDALAKINADLFDEDEGQLRYDITTCMKDKGYNTVLNGVPPSGVKDALECKQKAMAAKGWKETFGGSGLGKPGPGGPLIPKDSPFKNNCPAIGSTVVAMFAGPPGRSGHGVACKVGYCNPANGHAVLDCTESSASSGGALSWVANVGPSGHVVTNPQSSIDGGSCMGFTTVSASR